MPSDAARSTGTIRKAWWIGIRSAMAPRTNGAPPIAAVPNARAAPAARSVRPPADLRMRAMPSGHCSDTPTPVTKNAASMTGADVASHMIMNATMPMMAETLRSRSAGTARVMPAPNARPTKMPAVSAPRPAAAPAALSPTCSRRRSTPHRLMQNSAPM